MYLAHHESESFSMMIIIIIGGLHTQGDVHQARPRGEPQWP